MHKIIKCGDPVHTYVRRYGDIAVQYRYFPRQGLWEFRRLDGEAYAVAEDLRSAITTFPPDGVVIECLRDVDEVTATLLRAASPITPEDVQARVQAAWEAALEAANDI